MNVNFPKLYDLARLYRNEATHKHSGHIYSAIKNRSQVLYRQEVFYILEFLLERQPSEQEMELADADQIQNGLKQIYGDDT